MNHRAYQIIQRTLISPIEESISYQEEQAIRRTLIPPPEPQTLSRKDKEYIEKTLK